MGSDGMDFQYGGGGYVMSHALGRQKPWHNAFVRKLILRGAAPSRGDKNFFEFAKSPIPIYSPFTLIYKRFWLVTAALLGRLFGRV